MTASILANAGGFSGCVSIRDAVGRILDGQNQLTKLAANEQSHRFPQFLPGNPHFLYRSFLMAEGIARDPYRLQLAAVAASLAGLIACRSGGFGIPRHMAWFDRKGQRSGRLDAPFGEEQSLLVAPDTKAPTDWSHDGRFILYRNSARDAGSTLLRRIGSALEGVARQQYVMSPDGQSSCSTLSSTKRPRLSPSS